MSETEVNAVLKLHRARRKVDAERERFSEQLSSFDPKIGGGEDNRAFLQGVIFGLEKARVALFSVEA